MPKLSPRNWFTFTVLIVCVCILTWMICNTFHQATFEIDCLNADRLEQTDPEGCELAWRQLLERIKAAKEDIPDVALCNCYEKYGDFAFSHFRFGDADNLWKKGQDWAKKIGNRNFEAGFMSRRVFAQHFLFEQGAGDAPDPEVALKASTMRPEEGTGPSQHRANCFRGARLAYMDRGNYAKADEYLKKAIDEFEAAKVGEDYTFDPKCYRIENLIKQKKFAEANKLYLLTRSGFKSDEWKMQLIGNFMIYLRLNDPLINQITARVGKAFRARDFHELDSYAQTLTASGTVLPSGLWTVDELYEVLDDLKTEELNAAWEERIATFKQWEKSNPESDLARVALARCLISYAWKARGSGWANTVTKEGGDLFHQRLEQAAQVLGRVKHKIPGWYRDGQKIALGQSWDRSRYNRLFADCRKQYPTYYSPIFGKAYWILPRWYGKEGELEQFSEQQSHAISGPDGGDVLYARIAWSLSNRMMATVSDEGMSWPKIKSGLESIKKRYPSSPFAAGMITVIGLEYNDTKSAQDAYN